MSQDAKMQWQQQMATAEAQARRQFEADVAAKKQAAWQQYQADVAGYKSQADFEALWSAEVGKATKQHEIQLRATRRQAEKEFQRSTAQQQLAFVTGLESQVAAAKREAAMTGKQISPRVIGSFRKTQAELLGTALTSETEVFTERLSKWEKEQRAAAQKAIAEQKPKAKEEFETSLGAWETAGKTEFETQLQGWEVATKASLESQIGTWKAGETAKFEAAGAKVGEPKPQMIGLAESLLHFDPFRWGADVAAALTGRKPWTKEQEAAARKPLEVPLGILHLPQEYAAGAIAIPESFVYSVGQLAGFETPKPPPMGLEYGVPYYAGAIFGQIALGYGISAGVTRVTTAVAPSVISSIFGRTAISSGIGGLYGYIYSKGDVGETLKGAALAGGISLITEAARPIARAVKARLPSRAEALPRGEPLTPYGEPTVAEMQTTMEKQLTPAEEWAARATRAAPKEPVGVEKSFAELGQMMAEQPSAVEEWTSRAAKELELLYPEMKSTTQFKYGAAWGEGEVAREVVEKPLKPIMDLSDQLLGGLPEPEPSAQWTARAIREAKRFMPEKAPLVTGIAEGAAWGEGGLPELAGRAGKEISLSDTMFGVSPAERWSARAAKELGLVFPEARHVTQFEGGISLLRAEEIPTALTAEAPITAPSDIAQRRWIIRAVRSDLSQTIFGDLPKELPSNLPKGFEHYVKPLKEELVKKGMEVGTGTGQLLLMEKPLQITTAPVKELPVAAKAARWVVRTQLELLKAPVEAAVTPTVAQIPSLSLALMGITTVKQKQREKAALAPVLISPPAQAQAISVAEAVGITPKQLPAQAVGLTPAQLPKLAPALAPLLSPVQISPVVPSLLLKQKAVQIQKQRRKKEEEIQREKKKSIGAELFAGMGEFLYPILPEKRLPAFMTVGLLTKPIRRQGRSISSASSFILQNGRGKRNVGKSKRHKRK